MENQCWCWAQKFGFILLGKALSGCRSHIYLYRFIIDVIYLKHKLCIEERCATSFIIYTNTETVVLWQIKSEWIYYMIYTAWLLLLGCQVCRRRQKNSLKSKTKQLFNCFINFNLRLCDHKKKTVDSFVASDGKLN